MQPNELRNADTQGWLKETSVVFLLCGFCAMRCPSLNASHSDRQRWLSSSEYVLLIKQDFKFTGVDNLL